MDKLKKSAVAKVVAAILLSVSLFYGSGFQLCGSCGDFLRRFQPDAGGGDLRWLYGKSRG